MDGRKSLEWCWGVTSRGRRTELDWASELVTALRQMMSRK